MESVAVKDQSAFAARVAATRLANYTCRLPHTHVTCKVLNKVSCTCACNFRVAHTHVHVPRVRFI